jgi:hypothetical protein
MTLIWFYIKEIISYQFLLQSSQTSILPSSFGTFYVRAFVEKTTTNLWQVRFATWQSDLPESDIWPSNLYSFRNIHRSHVPGYLDIQSNMKAVLKELPYILSSNICGHGIVGVNVWSQEAHTFKVATCIYYWQCAVYMISDVLSALSVSSSETLVPIYQIIRRHIPEDHNLHVTELVRLFNCQTSRLRLCVIMKINFCYSKNSQKVITGTELVFCSLH